MSGVIYFISDGGGAIKIGFSSQVKKRFLTLNASSRLKLSLMGHVPGTMAQEKELHVQLSAFKVKGEWFRDCLDVRAAIDDILANGLAPAEATPDRVLTRHEREAQELGAYILKYGALKYGPDVLAHRTEIEREFHLPPYTLWSLRYRPRAALTAGMYFSLLAGAMAACAAAQKQLGIDWAAIKAIDDVHREQAEAIVSCEAEIIRLQATLHQTLDDAKNSERKRRSF